MPLPRPLPDIQRELRQLLADDPKAALDRLQALLPENTPKQDELFLLLGRYNALRQFARQRLGTDEEIRLLENQFRHDLLQFINDLRETDLGGAAASAAPAKPGPAQQGLLVYQVPQQMALGEETRCLVRIALDRDVLLENLDIIKHTEERTLRKISKSMQVELADPSGGRNFAIRGTSKAVQTIDFDGEEHTEWRFYVTPLREGQHILEIKVSVIELVDGEKEYRERVLEEEVRIVSREDAVASAEAPFKPAGEALAFAETWVRTDTGSRYNVRGLRVIALFLIFLLLGTTATTWAAMMPWEREGLLTNIFNDNAEGQQHIVDKYKNEPRAKATVVKAAERKAEITDSLADWRAVLQLTPDAPVQQKAIQKIETHEVKARSIFLQNATPTNLNQYVQDFPDSKNFSEVAQTAQAHPDLLPALETALAASVQRQATPQTADALLRYFPKAQNIELVAAVAQKQPELKPRLQAPIATAIEQNLKTATTPAEAKAVLPLLDHIADTTAAARVQAAAAQNPALKPLLPQIRQHLQRATTLAPVLPEVPVAAPADQDGDGVPDNVDRCPKEKGLPANNGCPRKMRSGLDMVSIEGDTFTMGCKDGRDKDCEGDEKPAHQVTLSGFQIGRYEITQADWRSVMGSDPPELFNKGCDECPVEGVSWDGVQVFIQKLNAQRHQHYRLPTEAEWEYAARGGNRSKNYLYAGGNDLDQVAWYDGNYEKGKKSGAQGTTHPVGEKAPNELGLYDMSGNVWEWCSDWYDSKYYAASPRENPKGPGSGSLRVGRGGSWDGDPQNCRSAYRVNWYPDDRHFNLGFRLALSLSLQ